MKTNYEEYLLKPKSLSVKQMQLLHAEILNELAGDQDAEELYEELIETATRYVVFRAKWLLLDREDKIKQDASRSACHNSLIVKFNMLARYLKQQGKEAKWRVELGNEDEDKNYRKTIGDFACYIVFINSLNAR